MPPIRIPLTSTGWTVLAIGVAAYVAGWLLGWVELMVFAAGCGLALAVGIPFVVGRLQLDIRRALEPDRVVVGNPASVILAITNSGRLPTARRTVEELIDGVPHVTEVGALLPGEGTTKVFSLPTGRRGVVEIGPTVVSKGDPLGLLRRQVAHTDVERLWVHPRRVALAALPVGFAKDLEGPTTDTSPAGDVAFHTLREYQYGDDYRHIHWPSTARTGWLSIPRTGALMVRHYVDNRRPHTTVVLDPALDAYGGEDEFELAVEIVASMAVTAITAGQPVAVRFGDDTVLGQSNPGTLQDLLDRLSLLEPGGRSVAGGLVAAAVRGVRGETGTSALAVVTGGRDVGELSPVVSLTRRTVNPIVIRVWRPEMRTTGTLPGASLVDTAELAHFRSAWNRMAR